MHKPVGHINVISILWGTLYSEEDVNRLFSMLQKNALSRFASIYSAMKPCRTCTLTSCKFQNLRARFLWQKNPLIIVRRPVCAMII